MRGSGVLVIAAIAGAAACSAFDAAPPSDADAGASSSSSGASSSSTSSSGSSLGVLDAGPGRGFGRACQFACPPTPVGCDAFERATPDGEGWSWIKAENSKLHTSKDQAPSGIGCERRLTSDIDDTSPSTSIVRMLTRAVPVAGARLLRVSFEAQIERSAGFGEGVMAAFVTLSAEPFAFEQTHLALSANAQMAAIRAHDARDAGTDLVERFVLDDKPHRITWVVGIGSPLISVFVDGNRVATASREVMVAAPDVLQLGLGVASPPNSRNVTAWFDNLVVETE